MSTQKTQVLIVDDDEFVLQLLRDKLAQSETLEVVGTENTVTAALRVLSELPHSDLVVVLSDVVMPPETPIESFATAGYKTVAMSTFDDEPHVTAALQQGAQGYVLKADGTDAIERAVHSVVDGGAPISPFVTSHLINRMRPVEPVQVTPRQEEVLRLVAEGLTNKEIGERLFVSESTVKKTVSTLCEKLGCSNRSGLVTRAFRAGIM
ncbi:MAG: response regulator transcription factor [Corynebacterium sp.]|nr:response regulator transcription factor [Corynebacterium sp.]